MLLNRASFREHLQLMMNKNRGAALARDGRLRCDTAVMDTGAKAAHPSSRLSLRLGLPSLSSLPAPGTARRFRMWVVRLRAGGWEVGERISSALMFP